MSWGAGLAASLLVILPRPTTWIVGLAAFLVRGGIVLFLLPIIVVPSPVGLANVLGPTITTFWLGGMSLGFATLVTAIFIAFCAWRSMRTWSVFTPRRTMKLSMAPGTPPTAFWRKYIFCARSSRLVQAKPPTTSL